MRMVSDPALPTKVCVEHIGTQRWFFALWPSPALRRALRDWIQPLRAIQQTAWRPVPSEQWHLTLSYLGGLSPVHQHSALAAAAQAAAQAQRFTIKLDSYGSFASARVVFAAPSEIPLAAQQLQTLLVQQLQAKGIVCDQRPWRPHITLFRRARCAESASAQWPQPVAALTWPVSEIVLVCSQSMAVDSTPRQQPSVVYRVLQRWLLPAAA